jgi:hypothetical protein
VDDDGVLRDNLDRALVLDVHNAAAHDLPVREIDEDAVAWLPPGLSLVHVAQDARANRLGLVRRRPVAE